MSAADIALTPDEQKALTQAAKNERFEIRTMGDIEIAHLIRSYERAIEDATDAGRLAGGGMRLLAKCLSIQKARKALSERYGSRCRYGRPGDRGSDSWDAVVRLGAAPTHELAMAIDSHNWFAGADTALDWSCVDRPLTPTDAGCRTPGTFTTYGDGTVSYVSDRAVEVQG